MREKLETLSLVQLKELAKSQGLKVSGKKKADIIALLCALSEQQGASGQQEETKQQSTPVQPGAAAQRGTPERQSTARVQQDAAQAQQNMAEQRSAEAQLGAPGRQNAAEQRSAEAQQTAPRQRRRAGARKTNAPDENAPAGIADVRRSANAEGGELPERGAETERSVGTAGMEKPRRRREYSRRTAPADNAGAEQESSTGVSENPVERGMGRTGYVRKREYVRRTSADMQTGRGRRTGNRRPEIQPTEQTAEGRTAAQAADTAQPAQSELQETAFAAQTRDVLERREPQARETAERRELQVREPAERRELQTRESAERGALQTQETTALVASEQQDARRAQDNAENRGHQNPYNGTANGILELMPDGYGFIRSENFLPGENDVFVTPVLIRKYNLKTGDVIVGISRQKSPQDKFAALLYINTVNGLPVSAITRRPNFESLTPVFPNERIRLESSTGRTPLPLRVLDLLAPIGKGQRGMIVSPPKAGKTTLLKYVAKAIIRNNPNMHLIILLIDERPEEVTDMKEEVTGDNVEVIYSTFDEAPEQHRRVSEMVIERAKRLVEQGQDVTILLDSITRLARAYNLVVTPSGRTLSGGLDPAALYMPKRFFGAARNMREGGSLTILATALIDTGSRMDDVIYEEFKGTGNMELVLDRKLQERRIFPAIDILKSGTRRDDLLLSSEEKEAADMVHKMTSAGRMEDVEKVLELFDRTINNKEFCDTIRKRFTRY